MEKIKNIVSEATHFWDEHKKVVVVFGVILIIAIIV